MTLRNSLLTLGALGVVFSATAFVATPPPPPTWKVVGWNNLGMHCMDSDYGVFSILPPYNTVDAQVVQPDGTLLQTLSGETVTYEAVADPSGSINKSSIGKTNFWQYATALYGASSTVNTGLAGFNMPGPGNTPRPMGFAGGVFNAEGIPIAPYDDAGHKRPYPMMKLTLRSSTGTELASTKVVLPVSDEMDCRACHASDAPGAAQPAGGWVHDPNSERDYRLNILRKHDEHLAGSVQYHDALVAAGFSTAGLEQTVVVQHTPILCAKCHASNALPGTGLPGISRLTIALHANHASAIDPINGLTLDANNNRSACYRCHPGSETRCLRGAMGAAVAANGTLAMQCQSCHGSMSTVGASTRVGWLDEPTCQNCHTGTATHNNGQIRYTDAFSAPGQLRTPVDTTFATTPDTPAPGVSLFRFSLGHGNLRCESCHGSTHAEYPAAHGNDNVQPIAFQGHVGVIADCTACHGTNPVTVNGGPHGMHPIGQDWVDSHHDIVENTGAQQCFPCHGADARGTVLSQAQGDRTLSTNWGTKTFFRGARISCYSCHNGPTSDDPINNARATAQSQSAVSNGAPVTVTLVATDPNTSQTLTYRIVAQPAHGTVSLSGNHATYYPEAGFSGNDPFTFAAFDGFTDSTLGTVTVVRGAEWRNVGTGFPGTGGVVPPFTLSGAPVLGTTIAVDIGNTAPSATTAVIIASADQAGIATPAGGVLLAEPTDPLVFTLPSSGVSIPWDIPNSPALIGYTIYAQVILADPGARFGWAFSRGLRASFGP